MNYLILFDGSIASKHTIHSPNLNELLNHNSPLNYLRELYTANIHLFYTTRDEMILRGIKLTEELQNNFFPSINYDDSPIITIEENQEKYKKINFNLMNLSGFTDRFEVKTDLFFNNIPLQGFTTLAKNISLEFVSSIFQDAGFNITNLKISAENKETIEADDLIQNVFPKSEFLSFHRYCSEKGYIYVSQLDNSIIENFIHQPQVGEKKVLKVLKKYEEYLKKISPPSFENIIDDSLDYFSNNSFKELCTITMNMNYLSVIEGFYRENFFTDLNSEEVQTYLSNLKDFISDGMREKHQKIQRELLTEFQNKSYTPYLMNMEVSKLKKMLIKKRVKVNWQKFDENVLLEDIIKEPQSTVIIKSLIEFQTLIISLKDQIEFIKDKLNERDLNCFILRNEHSLSLQVIAQKIGVTRERVRQIVKNVDNKISKLTDQTDLGIVLEFLPQEGLGVTQEYIKNFYNIKSNIDFLILDSMLRNSGKYVFNDVLKIYTSKKINNHITKKYDEIDKLKSILTINEIATHFNSLEADLTEDSDLIEKIDEIMKLKGYIKPGNLYFKKSITFKDKINYIFAHYVADIIKMDKTGFAIFSSILHFHFGAHLLPNEKSVIARIREAEDVILVDPLTFSYFDPLSIDQQSILELKQVIEDKLVIKEWINVSEIYDSNNKFILQNNVQSKYHLYSLIQYFFNDDFDIGKGNTLNIYRSNAVKRNAEDSLEEYLKKNNFLMTKEQILQAFHWPSYRLDQIVGTSDKFISFDSNTVMLFANLNMTAKEIDLVIRVLKNSLASGYAFSFEIYQEMQFDEQLNLLLNKCGIDNHYALLQLFKKILPEVKGHSNFLYYENCPLDSIEKYIIEAFPVFTSRKEIYEHILNKGYSDQMSQSVIRELMEKRHFLDYERNKIINRTAFSLNQEFLDNLKKYLEAEFKEKSYLSVIKLIGFKSHLPRLDIGDWTKHLIYHLGIEAGFRAIKTTSDYRFDRLLLVKPDSPYCSYDTLVKFILKNEYSGALHESNVASFLAEFGLAYNDQKLSYELKSSPLFNIDSLGWITFKEVN